MLLDREVPAPGSAHVGVGESQNMKEDGVRVSARVGAWFFHGQDPCRGGDGLASHRQAPQQGLVMSKSESWRQCHAFAAFAVLIF